MIELKISVIDTLCPRDSLQDKLCFLEQLGIEGIELESTLSGSAQEKEKSVREALSASKVKLSTVLLGYQGDLLSKHREIRQKTLEKIKQSMEVCAKLGGIGVVTVPSPRKSHNLFTIQLSRSKEARKRLAIEQYAILGKYAEELNVYVIIEPLDNSLTNFINTCNQAAEICRMSGSGMVKICPDFFHMSIEEPNISEKIKQFSDYIVHLHIGDNDMKSKFAVMPGKGNLDLKGIFGALKTINYFNYLSFDCKIPSEEELRSSVHFLKGLIQQDR